MALVLPVVVMFTFGMLEVGLFVACYVNGTYGARAAVRYAIVHGSASTNPCRFDLAVEGEAFSGRHPIICNYDLNLEP